MADLVAVREPHLGADGDRQHPGHESLVDLIHDRRRRLRTSRLAGRGIVDEHDCLRDSVAVRIDDTARKSFGPANAGSDDQEAARLPEQRREVFVRLHEERQ